MCQVPRKGRAAGFEARTGGIAQERTLIGMSGRFEDSPLGARRVKSASLLSCELSHTARHWMAPHDMGRVPAPCFLDASSRFDTR